MKLGQLLSKGIGNRIALHVYDSNPVFDFSLPSFLGLSLGAFQGRGPFGDEVLMIGVLIAALNSPVYVSIPVQDAAIVDEFLGRLDHYLANLAREEPLGGFGPITVDQDYYQLPLGSSSARGYSFRVGPIKWRFFWARLGGGLYVASQPFILEDLAAMASGEGEKPEETGQVTAHAMVRIRPGNWSRVLDNYQLGWAENNREACLHNIGPMTSLARAFAQSTAGKSAEQVHAGLISLGERFYDAHFYCPDGGKYQMAPDGKSVVCTLHGSACLPASKPRPPRRANWAACSRICPPRPCRSRSSRTACTPS